jgi:hypothetical protein
VIVCLWRASVSARQTLLLGVAETRPGKLREESRWSTCAGPRPAVMEKFIKQARSLSHTHSGARTP